MPLAAQFQDNLMLKPKRPIFKNYAKTLCFCAFFEYQLMSVKHNDDVTTISKKHKKIIAEIIDFSLFLIKILIIFRIDVRTRNFEVLGRILASILGVLGRSWGRLGASWAPLGPHFGAKVLTRRQPHHPTKKTRKPGVPKSWKIKGRRLGDAWCGDHVKQPIPKKASQKYCKTLGKTLMA